MYRSVGMRPGDSAKAPQIASATVIEEAERRGLRTGIITTTTLTHATPAAFFAHHEDRTQESDIAKFFVDMPERIQGSDGVDVAFAGGAKYFTPEQLAQLEARGVVVSNEWDGSMMPGFKQVLRLLAETGLPGATERMANKVGVPGLFYMIQSALFTLSDGNDKGFFLLVEGGQIDWKLHGLDTSTALIDEILDLDNAVGIALRYAREHEDTLVIVTADHDHTLSVLDNHYGFTRDQCGVAKRCGGDVEFEEMFAKGPYEIHRGTGFGARDLQGEFKAPKVILQYAWPVQAANQIKRRAGPHSANFVPLFAYGPGADQFAGFHQQPEIGQKLISWAKGQQP
jgi:alkaline phosphatase